MARINLLPADDQTNGWSGILSPHAEQPVLDVDVRADWVVVGAGFAGLAAARRLARNRPDEHVVLVEAQAVGEGASGRNSGFAIDLPHNVGSSMAELEGSHRFMRLARAAIEHLQGEVEAHQIDCQWATRGKYHAAVSTRGTREVLEPFAKELEALGETYEWVDKARLDPVLGTAHFTAAVYTPGCILMNPAALTRGLAESLPDNVTLYERSPVTEVDYRNGVSLKTPRGSVYAPRMIITVNGLAGEFGFYQGRLLRFAAHASLTRRLTEAEHEAIGAIDEWGLTPVNAFAGITMRYTADRRILIRQDIHYQPSLRVDDRKRETVRRRHEKLFHERFPRLPQVTLEHTWTGFICLSRNGSPGFGRVAPNVHASVCQNAVGVTKGTIGGILAADMACEQDNPLIADMQGLGEPDALPPSPMLDVGVRAKLAWELWKARGER